MSRNQVLINPMEKALGKKLHFHLHIKLKMHYIPITHNVFLPFL